jgi:hypothetical protein
MGEVLGLIPSTAREGGRERERDRDRDKDRQRERKKLFSMSLEIIPLFVLKQQTQ